VTALVAQGLAGIFNTLADAIEGGNTWRGSGTAFKGIPGQYSNDKDLPLTVTATKGTTTTVEDWASTWSPSKWRPLNNPPYFLLAASGTAANVGQHRKVASWSQSTPNDTGISMSVEHGSGNGAGDTATVRVQNEPSDFYYDGKRIKINGTGGATVTVDLVATIFGGTYDGTLVTALPVALDDGASYVTTWVDLDPKFTVSVAFSSAVQAADTFTVLQGFKRLPNGVDIESAEGAADGYDRTFHLSAGAGKRTEWSGTGAWLLETQLKLRVRFLKFGRLHDWTAAAMTNMAILRAGLAKTIHYETTYMRALIPDGNIEIVHEDNNKLVAEDTFRLFYRFDTSFT
jgi:hypothetical protein